LAVIVRQLAEINGALVPVQPVKIWPGAGDAVRQTVEPEVYRFPDAFAFAHRLVIYVGPVDPQQLALPPDADLRLFTFHQRRQLFNRARRLFF
jgi:hypothetical protein